jgi:uncharacterized protein involved in type VI secretion and phage assembly
MSFISAPADKYYGKYRGTVRSNLDPLQIGRVVAVVPDISGQTPLSWALPCLPYAGTRSGTYVVPDVGSTVWIEFEQGNLDYPIWTGCFWSSDQEVPATALAAPPGTAQVLIQTPSQNSMLVSDQSGPAGGIVLRSAAGAAISISDSGITIDNGQGATIQFSGATVSINGEALVIT